MDRTVTEETESGFGLLETIIQDGPFEKQSEEYLKYSKLRGSINALEGLISAGKTTLGNNLKSYLTKLKIPCVFIEEKASAAMRDLFYKDPRGEAFNFQIFMLCKCLETMAEAYTYAKEKGMVVFVDREIWGNAVFAAMHTKSGNISAEQWQVYKTILKTEGSKVQMDAVVYLDCDPEVCHARVKERGHASEIGGVSLEYLQELEKNYSTAALLHMKTGTAPVIPISWNKYGKVKDVLDLLVEKPRCVVTGDVQTAYASGRGFRADLFQKLIREKRVDIDSSSSDSGSSSDNDRC